MRIGNNSDITKAVHKEARNAMIGDGDFTPPTSYVSTKRVRERTMAKEKPRDNKRNERDAPYEATTTSTKR